VSILCHDIAVDSQQNSYVAGDFRQDAAFDEIVLPGTSNDYDIFLAKYSAQWPCVIRLAGWGNVDG